MERQAYNSLNEAALQVQLGESAKKETERPKTAPKTAPKPAKKQQKYKIVHNYDKDGTMSTQYVKAHVEYDEVDAMVLEYFSNYFGGTLNESTSDEDIMDAVYDLIDLAEAVCDAVGLDEGSMGWKRLLRKSKGIKKAQARMNAMNPNSLQRIRQKKGDWPLTMPHSASDVGADILASRAAKTRDQIKLKTQRRNKRSDELALQSAIHPRSKVRKIATDKLTRMTRQDSGTHAGARAGKPHQSLDDAGRDMKDIAGKRYAGRWKEYGTPHTQPTQAQADKAVKDREYKGHRTDTGKGTLDRSDWKPLETPNITRPNEPSKKTLRRRKLDDVRKKVKNLSW